MVFVCGRLFELDPALLNLFHYSTNCDSKQDCLSSPEFLDHVTKVSPHPHNPETFQSTVLIAALHASPLSPQVMLVIDAAVSHLDDLHSLEDFLLNLGRKHQAVGVSTQSFTVRLTHTCANQKKLYPASIRSLHDFESVFFFTETIFEKTNKKNSSFRCLVLKYKLLM